MDSIALEIFHMFYYFPVSITNEVFSMYLVSHQDYIFAIEYFAIAFLYRFFRSNVGNPSLKS